MNNSDNLPTNQPVSRALSIPPMASAGLVPNRTHHAIQSDESTAGAAILFSFLRHWWWKCLLVGTLLAGLAGTAVWLTFRPMYEASTWIEIKGQPMYVAFEPHMIADKSFFQTQLETIKSPVVLLKVSTRPEIASLKEAQEFEIAACMAAEVFDGQTSGRVRTM